MCSKGCDPPQTSCCAVDPITHIRARRHVTTGSNRASLEIYRAGDQSMKHGGCSVPSLSLRPPTLSLFSSYRSIWSKRQPAQRTWQWCNSRIMQHFHRTIIRAIFLETLPYIFSRVLSILFTFCSILQFCLLRIHFHFDNAWRTTKSRIVPESVTKAYGKMEVQFHSILTSTLNSG